MKRHITDASIEISLTAPGTTPGQLMGIAGLIDEALLNSTGLEVRRVNEDGEPLYATAEVFPEANPGMAMRGFRLKEEWTQEELAERLGINQTRVSELESGKRPISLAMAKRLGQVFDMPYKAFL
jgi:DNA-binding XRE family transcriptional regulator